MEDASHKAMALADGELSAADLPGLVGELARNTALLRLAQRFMAVRRNRIAKLYARKLEEPVPQWLIDKVMTAPVATPAREPNNVFSYGSYASGLLDRLRRKYRMPAWTFAAGPALAAALALSVSWLLVPASGPAAPLLTAELQFDLENAASAKDRRTQGFRPLVTYWSNDQAWCRQFSVESPVEQTFAVACRADNGNWRIVLQTPPVLTGGMRPAGSTRAHLDKYVASNQSGAPLDATQLEATMKAGWQPPANQ